MKGFKHVCIAALGSAALAFGMPSAAIPVTVGSPVTFDFQAPTPGTFTSYTLVFDIVTCSVFETEAFYGCHGTRDVDGGSITLFDGLSARGTSRAIGAWSEDFASGSLSGPANASAAALLDGVFSLVYAATIGQIEVGTPFVMLTSTAGTIRVNGVSTAAVPEPESMALLGIGSLAAVGIARRRRRRGPRVAG